MDTNGKNHGYTKHSKKWVAAFKLGRISTEGEHRPGRPVESVTQENIDKIHDLVMLDRRMTVRQIEQTLGIPKTTVDRIMREHLGLRKLSARWVPKLLTPDQKAVRRKLSSDNLALFEANPEKFVNRFVSMDETWAHHFTAESKQQSMQWRHSGSPPPRKPRQLHQQGRKIVYHQDNAPSHRSLQAMAAIHDSGFELLPHAPYSPDLAPSNPAASVERRTSRQRGIMVWGTIAYDNRSCLICIESTMTAQRYVDDVLWPVTLPFLQGVLNVIFQQDNARPHRAYISQHVLYETSVLPLPLVSSDLSLIEHVWDVIGCRLRALPQPRSEDELWLMVDSHPSGHHRVSIKTC
ncbi:hypothetical protein LAZ67_21002182 [Cordylochernes scorpioides]|uniref:Transposase n=1 Tax=Cordylochernes scorpioides TaxID=51811 RepID=A0ABY6LQ54_9ARAC|nr:hypothetical protein LAZ67_21002182 [Cordylochernes scorpioides]